MQQQMPILQARNLGFSHGQGKRIFQGLSLRIPQGAFVLVRGGSGAGKSTLLRLLARLEEPSEGALYFRGREYASFEPPALRGKVCYVQQTPTVIDASVRDNLLLPFGFRLHRERERPPDAALRGQLDALLLPDVDLDDNALLLSVGQKQRLCLARTLLLRPEALLLDEPTSALDAESRATVRRLTLQAHQEQGVTILLVSHVEDEGYGAASPLELTLGDTPEIPEELR